MNKISRMKKLIALLAIAGLFTFGLTSVVLAQDKTDTTTEEQVSTQQLTEPHQQAITKIAPR